MGLAKFRLNGKGIEELLNGSAAEEACRPRAERVLAAAQAAAPVASGEYQGSLRLVEDSTDRKVFRVVSDAPHAMIVEANTGNLSRALDSAR